MLTVKQAAERLAVSQATVYAMCHGHILPHVRIGVGRGTVRIDERDLDAFIRGATVRPQELDPPSLPREKFKHLRV